MAVQRFTFPQTGDADDAEHFASMIGQSNLSSYVETGLEFTYDDTVPEVSISQGKGYISLSSDVASSTGEDILEVNHVVQVPQQTVSLTGSAVNYIYLEPNFGSDDNGTISAYTSQQSGSVLLIGTIDTTADEVTELNRNPSIDAQRLGLGDDQNLDFGDNDDFAFFYDSSENRLALENDANTRLADVGDTDWQMEVPLALNGNALNDVSSIDGGGDDVQFDDSIDLTDQNISYDLNAGVQNLVSFSVDSSSTAGTEHSYDLDINGTSLLKFYAESDGAGSVQNEALDALVDLDLNSNNIDNVASIDGGGSAVTFDDPIDVPADSLDATEVDIARGLEDDGTGSIQFDEDTAYTFTSQQQFDSGISVSGSVSLDADSIDATEVDIGRGLEDDGTGAIQFDEDESYVFTAQQTFNAGLQVADDITDDSAGIIWDSSAQEITNSALGSIDSNTDGVVDDSDQYSGTAPSDGSNGQFLKTDGTTTLWDTVKEGNWTGDGTLLSPDDPEIGIDVEQVDNGHYSEDHLTDDAWLDLNTTSTNTTTDISANTTTPEGVAFNGDGTVVFVSDSGSATIEEFSLSTAYDISSVTHSSSHSLSNVDNPVSITFGQSGSSVYISEGTNGNIQYITLNTAYDLTSVSSNNSVSVSGITTPAAIAFGSGSTVYIADNSDQEIYEYNLSTPWDITTASATGGSTGLGAPPGGANRILSGLDMHPKSRYMYAVDEEYGNVYELSFTTPGDLTDGATVIDQLNVSGVTGSPVGLDVNDIGTTVYYTTSTEIASSEVDQKFECDVKKQNVYKVTVHGDTEFGFQNFTGGRGNSVTIRIVQDSTGGHSITFSNTRWPGGSAPSWSTSANALDVVSFAYDPEAVTWDGFLGGTNFS